MIYLTGEDQGPTGELCSKGLDAEISHGFLIFPRTHIIFIYTLSHDNEWWGVVDLVASVMATRRTRPIEESQNVIAAYIFFYIMYIFS